MDSHSSTQPTAVRLVISMLKRYSPRKEGRRVGGERERERASKCIISSSMHIMYTHHVQVVPQLRAAI